MLALLVLGRAEWLWPALLLIALAAAWIWFADRPRWRLAPIARWSSLGKWLALSLLAFSLTEPLWSSQRALPGANLFLLLGDNSQSLALSDPGQTTSRGEQLKTVLTTTAAPWQVRLEQDFDVRRYLFDSHVKYVPDFSTLVAEGDRSDLGSALKSLRERMRDRPVAGILLFTDGNSTDAVDAAAWRDLPPVYPVPIGSSTGHRDLSLSNVQLTTTSFEDAPVTLVATITHQGFPNDEVTVRVEQADGKLEKQETLRTSGETPLVFRFQLRPTARGVTFYRVLAALGSGDAAFADRAKAGEATLANNDRLVTADRGNGPYRLLYLSGRPNWEYKFLQRALVDDDQLNLMAMIRIAKRESKFDFRGRDGEGTNPLFRGFDRTGEETERHDQPVIVRLNPKTPDEFRDGFPKTAADLYQFHAVILDDLEAAFFTTEQLSLLERFVSERGGGLLMLGGQESFRQGGYQKTPLARALPVYLDAQPLAIPAEGLRLGLTREGWLQPWARLRATEGEEVLRLKQGAPQLTVNAVSGLKPGASAIADLVDLRGQKYPALIAQQFGQGRCAALLVGDLWRSQLQQADDQREKDNLGKSWRQMLRWLIVDVPDRIAMQPIADDSQGTPLVRLQVRVRDAEYHAQDNAAVALTLTPPEGPPITLPAEPSLSEPGLYEAVTSARPEGAWRATAAVIDAEGRPLGESSTGWAADPLAQEMASTVPNRKLLESLAKGTGGRLVELDDLASFVATLPQKTAPVTETTTTPAWHHPLVWLVIVLGLCGDWAVRRRMGWP